MEKLEARGRIGMLFNIILAWPVSALSIFILFAGWKINACTDEVQPLIQGISMYCATLTMLWFFSIRRGRAENKMMIEYAFLTHLCLFGLGMALNMDVLIPELHEKMCIHFLVTKK